MNTRFVIMLSILPLFAFVAGWYVTDSSDWQIDNDYAHVHATSGHTIAKICGDHICKPGEKYNP